jgi:hypothetical protein
VAVIKQLPVLRSVTRLLAVVQTEVVFEVKVTGSSELACAAIGNGGTPRILLGIGSNVIV